MTTLPPKGIRPVIYRVKGNYVTTYKVEAKGTGFRKVLGTLDSFAEAMGAFDHFTATGELPPRAKRGPKGPQKNKAPRPAPRPRAEPQNGDRVKRPEPRDLAPATPRKGADSATVQKANRLLLIQQIGRGR